MIYILKGFAFAKYVFVKDYELLSLHVFSWKRNNQPGIEYKAISKFIVK